MRRRPPLATPRAVASAALEAWDGRKIFITITVPRERTRLHDPRDRALMTNIAYSTVRWLGWADAVLDRRLDRGIGSLPPGIRAVLRCGVIQLCKMKGQEPHAVVNESVAIAHGLHGGAFSGLSGLVNAVLRGIVREPPGDDEAATGDDEISRLSHRHSHPKWIVERWLHRYGRERTESILRWNNTPPPLSLRVRGGDGARQRLTDEIGAAGVEASPGSVLAEVLRVEAGFIPEQHERVRDGTVVIQDESEAIVSCLWSPEPPVLDACAGPGTKAGHTADRVGPDGLVLAWDVGLGRAMAVQETARRLSRPNLLVANADATRPPCRRSFPSILVDAPCSNLGVLCRRPDARWFRRPEDIPVCAERQRALLRSAVDLLAPGGYVLYSVCTLEPEETDQVIAPFLAANGGELTAVDPPGDLPGELVDGSGGEATLPRGLRILPGTAGMEGVFAVLLRRSS